MKKTTLLILCALFVFTTNTIHAQTITIEEDRTTTIEDQQLNDSKGSEEITVQQDEQADSNNNNSNNDQSNNQNNIIQNTTTRLTPQKTSLSDRIKQQAKAVREKVMTQVNRNRKLSETRNSKLQNTTDNTQRTVEGNQATGGVVVENPSDNNATEITIDNNPTVGQKYRIAFNKLTDIQIKIENAINEVQSSTKIDAEKLKESLENSKESLSNSNQKIQELEKIPTSTKIDQKTRAVMVEAKKGLLESKQYLNTILVALKQATKAKAIIQTGGGTTGSGGTSGSGTENGGQTDGNNTGGTETGDQPRR